jgi:hypothetical protein
MHGNDSRLISVVRHGDQAHIPEILAGGKRVAQKDGVVPGSPFVAVSVLLGGLC